MVIGAAGQARETEWLLRDLRAAGQDVAFAGLVVSNLDTLSDRDSRDLVVGDESWLDSHRGDFDALALGIGTPEIRLRVAGRLLERFDESWWPPLIHPSAVYDRQTCTFGPGTMVAAGVVATVNVDMQPFSLANFGCTIGHETRIGRGSVINPGANLSGGIRIGDGVLVGTGAQVLQYLTVGDGAIVGAGAVVTRDVAAGVTVVGCPARPRA